MKAYRQRAVIFSLAAATIANSGCSGKFFLRALAPDSGKAAIELPSLDWADQRASRLSEKLLLDKTIAGIPGIGSRMASMPGICVLHDLAGIADEKAQLRMARRAFSLLSRVEEDFMREFCRLQKNGTPRLEAACLAFWRAMETNMVEASQKARFGSGLGAQVPHADCDVAGIMFVELARKAGLDVVGLQVSRQGDFSKGYFLAAYRSGKNIEFVIDATCFLAPGFGMASMSEELYREALRAPDEWKEGWLGGIRGSPCLYLEPESIVLAYTTGKVEGFGGFVY